MRPQAAGPSRSPARNAGPPCIRSSPFRRRLSPDCTTFAGKAMRPSGIVCVNSCGTTVSRPVGMIAPVMIFTHWPGRTMPCQALPARAVPATSSSSVPPGRSCALSNAKPSIAELSCGGTLMGETRSAASTRPSASNTATDSVSRTGSTSRARKSLTASADSACGS